MAMIHNSDRIDGLVSVVVPIYNQDQYLPRCLASLRRQTYTRLEIILVDDGSNDGSGQMCDQYAMEDPRCIVIHKENEGAWSARNAGHDVAKGNWLIFIDSDDYFNHDMIRVMYRAAISYPDADLVMVNAARTTSQEEDISPLLDSDFPSAVLLSRKEVMEGLTSRDNFQFAAEWNKLYRHDLIDNIRHRNYVMDEDFDFNLRVFPKSRGCLYLDKTLYWWFQHPKSVSRSADHFLLHYKSRFKILTETLHNYPEDGCCFEGLLLKRLFRDVALFSGWQYRRKLGTPALEAQALVNIAKKCHLRPYLMRKDIRFLEKLGCLMMLKSPFFAHKLMKLTKNM